ncbi:hypothetical protein Tco_1531767 [Tanacetum coccineum]
MRGRCCSASKDKVRIIQKSHENRQKQGKQRTREQGAIVNINSSQDNGEVISVNPRRFNFTPTSIKGHIINGRSTRGVGFCAKTFTKEAQMHPKENNTLAILRCPQFDQTAYNSSSNDWKMIGQD